MSVEFEFLLVLSVEQFVLLLQFEFQQFVLVAVVFAALKTISSPAAVVVSLSRSSHRSVVRFQSWRKIADVEVARLDFPTHEIVTGASPVVACFIKTTAYCPTDVWLT